MSAADVTPGFDSWFELHYSEWLRIMRSGCNHTEINNFRGISQTAWDACANEIRSAPVAVEVPEAWNEDSCRKILSLINERDEAVRLAESLRIDAAANLLRSVPPSRILKDGERAVPVEKLLGLLATISQRRSWLNLSREEDADIQAIYDALRSGEAEGRMG